MMRFTSSRPRRSFHRPPGRENALSQVEYTSIRGVTVAQLTENAVLLSKPELDAPVWVPLFRFDPLSRVAIIRMGRGAQLEVNLQVPTAIEKGLV